MKSQSAPNRRSRAWFGLPDHHSPLVYSFAGGPRLKVESWPFAPDSDRVSVIIPVLNESARIASVVAFALKSSLVDEVIVVDDGSIDGTPELAHDAGAKVITSTLLGKGASMEDGLNVAQNEILLYLDGDLTGLHPELVATLPRPLPRAAWTSSRPAFPARPAA